MVLVISCCNLIADLHSSCRRSLTDQYKAQAQSNSIALKAEQQSHQATTAKLSSVQQNLDMLEKKIMDLRNENTDLAQTNENLNEQIFEMNLNHQMEINELKDELEHVQRSLKEQSEADHSRDNATLAQNDAIATANTESAKNHTKKVQALNKEIAQFKEELALQTNRAVTLDEQIKSASEKDSQLEKLKLEVKDLKQTNEKLQRTVEANKKSANTSTKVHQLEQRLSELQTELTKAQEEANRMRAQQSQSTNIDHRQDTNADKFAALHAEYQLAMVENKYLKKAKVSQRYVHLSWPSSLLDFWRIIAHLGCLAGQDNRLPY